MTTPFWFNDPTILFNKSYVLQLWPSQQMTFEAKMNAISRLVIAMTILGFLFTRKWNIIVIGIVTLAIIFSIYKFRKQSIISSLVKKEGFQINPPYAETDKSSPSMTSEYIKNPVTLDSVLRSEFYPTTKRNPFGNVLLTDIYDDPDRKSAAPCFNPDVYDDINKATKKQTQM
jgi:hypothetical protein